jgi:hypothetical protein
MKKLIVIFALSFIPTSIFAQANIYELTGVWKIVQKNSDGKKLPPEYMLFKSNNTYIWGVDSLGVDPKQGENSGTWFITKENEIVLISSDTGTEVKYYIPDDNGRLRFDATQKGKIKEPSHMPGMDIYLEKFR